jgi:hypothetical protein
MIRLLAAPSRNPSSPTQNMADYVPVISQAVARLAINDSADREALYARARDALVVQLGRMPPALTLAQLVHEQHDLERAIRTVEAQYAMPSYKKAEAPVAGGIAPIAPMPKLFPRTA